VRHFLGFGSEFMGFVRELLGFVSDFQCSAFDFFAFGK
jgi:hypothetical protein